MLRKAAREDFAGIRALFCARHLTSPKWEELAGGIVAVSFDGSIIGFIGVCHGNNATAYLDWLIVSESAVGTKASKLNHSVIGLDLVTAMLTYCAKHGATRVVGTIQDTPIGRALAKTYAAHGCKVVPGGYSFSANIDDLRACFYAKLGRVIGG